MSDQRTLLAEAIRRIIEALALVAEEIDQQPTAVTSAASAGARSVREAAQQLAVSEKHLRRQITSGTLRAIRIGNRIVVPEAAINELLNELR